MLQKVKTVQKPKLQCPERAKRFDTVYELFKQHKKLQNELNVEKRAERGK